MQEVIEGNDNTDTVMHEPLLAEEETLPTPPESPLINELDHLMPSSSPGRTPSPSPGIILKEEPKLLHPGSWSDDKTIKDGSAKGSSKLSSKPSSRPTTPLVSVSVAPEEAVAPGRTPSRQSNKNEQGSDLEIKALQKFDSRAKPSEPTPIRNNLISPDEEEALQPTSHVPSKVATPEPEPTELKPEIAASVHERAPSISKNIVESREVSRTSSKAETKALSKLQPSPAPTPKPAPSPEPKPATKQVEAKVTQKAEPKAEARLKVSIPRTAVTTESLELEVKSLSTEQNTVSC